MTATQNPTCSTTFVNQGSVTVAKQRGICASEVSSVQLSFEPDDHIVREVPILHQRVEAALPEPLEPRSRPHRPGDWERTVAEPRLLRNTTSHL